ncbi:MAG TPA: hypothetical protein DCE41_28765 [Cytophagales bacterium]|nr:hypothetical protein [Cytophagales bacterium]HAA19697.1 hypothetical protein [Cytophagales bacterium]HAP61642.1 hypothetical protein [Cytophagales bacterium]
MIKLKNLCLGFNIAGILIVISQGFLFAQIKESPFEELLLYFELGQVPLPEPLAEEFLNEAKNEEIFTYQLISSPPTTPIIALFENTKGRRAIFHLVIFNQDGSVISQKKFQLPDLEPNTLAQTQLLGDTLVEITYSTYALKLHEYFYLNNKNEVFQLEKKPVTRHLYEYSFLFERLITPADLSEVTIEDLELYRNYILAVRKYKFPDPDLRIYFNQNVFNYQARYSLLRRVPLTQLERLNLMIISNHLKKGSIPKDNDS